MPSPSRIPDDDSEDEDLKLALALSLQEQQGKASLSLDRKAMEAERLARLKKRKREDEEGSVAVAPAAKIPDLRRPIPGQGATIPVATPRTTTSPAVRPGADTANTNPTPVLYHDGIVLKTHAPGYPTDRTIAFSELVAPMHTLKSCLLSSFIWDFDWLFQHFNTRSTNFLLVMQAKSAQEREKIEEDFDEIANIRVCFPPMDGQVNCMHSKLMLLFWDDRCRIVVPTANLTAIDWGVHSVMENMTVPDEILKKLDLFDFSKTRHVGFVHSIGGYHTGDKWRQTGHCGLGATVSEMGLANEGPIEVDFVTSSVGSLRDDFMRSMYLAMQGDDGLTELTLRSQKRRGKTGQNMAKAKSVQDWRGRFRVYFPSADVVRASKGGARSAGTICFSQKWWEAQTFPRHAMRDCVSVREGLLMHNKLILVRYCNPKQTNGRLCMGYAYVGSANLSESAWGRLVQATTAKGQRDGGAKQNLRNWEAGVILPCFEGSGDAAAAAAALAKENPDNF
ncbi:hypothetical protein DV735_g671, partial [Chaetothyriales sp. CBS 134920]